MSSLEITLFGTPLVMVDGKAVKTDRRKAIALLVYLAVTAKTHTRDHLATMLWPDYEKESAYAYLRRTLWELNQALGKGWIALEGDQAGMQAGADIRLDTAVFEKLVQSSQAADLTEAIQRYRGEFLEGFTVADTAPFEDWQLQQVEYFHQRFAGALEKLVNAQEHAGDFKTALPTARRWLALDPLHEPAHRAIMRLLAEMGDRSGAVRQYETCVQLLKAELGVAPQPETTQLHQAILHGEVRASPGEQAVVESAGKAPPKINLPVLPTQFIGRRPEVEQLKLLLQDPDRRLVTLVGAGGMGKTRLSIQAASEVGEYFPDGVFFTPLASVQGEEAVIASIAKALDFAFTREDRPRQQLLDYLRNKQMLLVLDNFEHLLDTASLVSDILANAPKVKLLITTRVRLNIQGEQLFQVRGMRLPNLEEVMQWKDTETQVKPYSAVQLFLERARRVSPGFKLSRENVKEVLEICRLVQGMPLGLELAAAWLELLTPAEIAEEIHRSLDFLETSQGDVPDRQRSIRAVFESSWKLLSEAEQAALRRLSVFVESFSREAAQDVSGAPLRILLGLMNKSWLQQIGEGHFQLHDLLTHYVQENLKTNEKEWQDAHDRHAAFHTRFVAEQVTKMKGPDQAEGMRALEEEIASNVKAAWDWLIAKERWAEIVNPYAIGMLQVGVIRGQMAGMLPLVRAARLKLAESEGKRNPQAFAILSTLEVFFEENEAIKDFQPIERLTRVWLFVQEHDLAEAMGLWFVLITSLIQARNLDSDAANLLAEAVARLRKQKDQWELGIALLYQSNVLGLYGYDEEKILEAEKIFENLGVWFERGVIAEILCRRAISQKRPLSLVLAYNQQANQFYGKVAPEFRSWGALVNITGLYFREGMIEQGFAVHREMQADYERVGNQQALWANAQWESLHAVRYSTFEHALRTRLAYHDLAEKYGGKAFHNWSLFELGDIYRIFGQTDKALPLIEEARVGFRKLYVILGLSYCHRALGDVALKAGQYADALDHYEQFVDYATLDNHSWSMAQAHAKHSLALAFLGKTDEARQEMKTMLIDIQDWGEDELVFHALLTEAVCLTQEGKNEQAVELCAFIAAQPVTWNEIKWQAQGIQQSAAQHLSEEAVQQAVQRGQLLKLDPVVAALGSQKQDG